MHTTIRLSAVVFAIVFVAFHAMGQKLSVMVDPEESGNERTIVVLVKENSITRISIMDRDGGFSRADEIKPGSPTSFSVPNGKTYLVSGFGAGGGSALDTKIVAVSSSGVISFSLPKSQSSEPNVPKVSSSDTLGKLRLQAASEVKGPTLPLTIHRGTLKPINGKFVVVVTNGSRTDTNSDTAISSDLEKKSQQLTATIYKGENTITVYPIMGKEKLTDSGDTITVSCTDCSPASDTGTIPTTKYSVNPKLRVNLSFEQQGASSAASETNPSIEVSTTVPMGGSTFRWRGNRRAFKYYFFNDIALTSTPTQVLPDFGNLTAVAVNNFFGSNNSGKVNEMVKSFRMRIGLEAKIGGGFGVIAGVGATTTLAPDKTAVAYKIPKTNGVVNPDFQAIFAPGRDLTGIDNLILTAGDRARFLRNWFFGGRLHHQLFGSADEIYPAIFELTVGQDEVLTNKLRGGVLKFNTLIPVKISDTNSKMNAFYFGASFSTRLTRKDGTQTLPFFLEPATNITLTGNNNFIRNFREIPQLNSDRDIFSFRFGVDLIQLITGRKPADEAKQQ